MSILMSAGTDIYFVTYNAFKIIEIIYGWQGNGTFVSKVSVICKQAI